MKTIIKIILFILAIRLINHPNTRALYIGLRSSFIEDPLKKAKADFRKEAERQAKKREKARMKEIDAALDKAEKRQVSVP